MSTAVKFCGLAREEDAAAVAELGAQYAGVIFAGGPRKLGESSAAAVLAALSPAVKRVGVMGNVPVADMARRADRLRLDVIQMHGDPAPDDIRFLRELWKGEIWVVVRADDVAEDGGILQLFCDADGLLIDSGSRGTQGGSGRAFDWGMPVLRSGARVPGRKVIVAGGLTAGNVAGAIRLMRPDIVDVSSGVESSPGVKDHGKMREFVAAVRSVSGD